MTISTQPTVMVVGGTGNVGRHLVQAQLLAGSRVVVPSRDQERLNALGEFLSADRSGPFIPVLGDMTDRSDARRILEETGPIDGAVVSLGGFVAAPSLLNAPRAHLERAFHGYPLAHFSVAQALIPMLQERRGGYVMINGPLAFNPNFPGAGLVSIATAAQSMLARTLIAETADTPVRINELVIYSSFGWGNDDDNQVGGADIGRYVAYLLSEQGSGVSGETIHLRSPDALELLPAGWRGADGQVAGRA